MITNFLQSLSVFYPPSLSLGDLLPRNRQIVSERGSFLLYSDREGDSNTRPHPSHCILFSFSENRFSSIAIAGCQTFPRYLVHFVTFEAPSREECYGLPFISRLLVSFIMLSLFSHYFPTAQFVHPSSFRLFGGAPCI